MKVRLAVSVSFAALAVATGSVAGAGAAPRATVAAGQCGAVAERPWCDVSLSPDRRARLLLAELTAEERIGLLAGDELFGITGSEDFHTGVSDGIPRVGLPTVNFSDGPVGTRQGQATAMPVPLALAATWDPRMARRHAGTIGDEVRKKGNDVIFAPTVETMRTPLAGRAFEAYGEDPFLGTELTVAWIRAVQAQGVIASVKHFTPNSQEGTGPLANLARPGNQLQALGTYAVEGNRMQVNARVDERTLREIYLPQFEAAVRRGNAGSVMCAYNKLNGTYACEHGPLLEGILRDEWGFEGFVLADYGGAHSVGQSLTSGLDFEPWPGLVYSPPLVQAALAAGDASMTDVDAHVLRYLRTLFAYGVFDRPAYANDESRIDRAAHVAAARRIEESAITLLRNDGVLPLDARRLDSIAVIGAGADTFVTGGGSSQIDTYSFSTPLEAITKRAGGGVRVSHADGSDIEEAAALAAGADVAIVLTPNYMTEGVDRTCLSLDCPPVFGDEDALIEAVATANDNTVAVLETGGPVLTPWRQRIAALLEAWYPGAGGGAAIAHVLFGDSDPGGRLPVTFPQRESDLPTAGDASSYPGVGNQLTYREGVFVGYRHFDEQGIRPAFPFGHGLSYTSFRFSGLRIDSGDSHRARISLRVTNTGERHGIAVPQLYLGLPSPAPDVPQPPRQLRGFEKLALGAGESRRVGFDIGRRDLRYWDPEQHGWRVEPGRYRVFAGSSSRRLPLRGAFQLP